MLQSPDESCRNWGGTEKYSHQTTSFDWCELFSKVHKHHVSISDNKMFLIQKDNAGKILIKKIIWKKRKWNNWYSLGEKVWLVYEFEAGYLHPQCKLHVE